MTPPGAPSRGHRLRTVLVVLLCCLTCTLAVAFAHDRRNVAAGRPLGSEDDTGVFLLIWLVGIALAIATGWRTRWPELLTAFGVIAALVLPLEPTPALVGLTQLIIRRRDGVVWAAGAAVTVATLLSVWRDSRGRTSETSFWQVFSTGPAGTDHEPLPIWVVALITVAVIGATVAIALVLRSRRAVLSYARRDAAQAQALGELHETMTRQAERDRLAQEVHDVLGHRLSLLSLHAGALQVSAHDPRAARSAALVRDSAQQSMDDLRALLAMVRDPHSDLAAPVRGLSDLPCLIDESLAAGSPVVASVYVEASGTVPELISRTTYRVVQELLTNARKHAPQAPIRLQVTGSAVAGIEISTANRTDPRHPAAVSPLPAQTALADGAALAVPLTPAGPSPFTAPASPVDVSPVTAPLAPTDPISPTTGPVTAPVPAWSSPRPVSFDQPGILGSAVSGAGPTATSTVDASVLPGSGLISMGERVRQVGGRSQVWVDAEGAFRVAVWLPWGAADPGQDSR